MGAGQQSSNKIWGNGCHGVILGTGMGLSGGLIWSYLGDGMGTCGNDCVTGGKGGQTG